MSFPFPPFPMCLSHAVTPLCFFKIPFHSHLHGPLSPSWLIFLFSDQSALAFLHFNLPSLEISASSSSFTISYYSFCTLIYLLSPSYLFSFQCPTQFPNLNLPFVYLHSSLSPPPIHPSFPFPCIVYLSAHFLSFTSLLSRSTIK